MSLSDDSFPTVTHDGTVEIPVNYVTSDIEDEEDVLLEPRYKYDRILELDVKEMFSKQVATCVVAHDKFIAIGTQAGYVYVMDHQGHVDHKNIPVYRPHRCAVTRLAVDDNCHYVMSCAADARVVIHGIGCNEFNHVSTLKYVPRSIAVCEEFSRANSGQMFLVGERNLTLFEKRFFKYRETPLFSGAEKDGFITRTSWKGHLIAFTNEQGTRIYHRREDRTITMIAPSHDVDRLKSMKFPPVHCWLDGETLAIGWADTITIVRVAEGTEDGIRMLHGEIHFSWHLEMSISGISFMLGPNGSWAEIAAFGLKPGDEDAENGVDAFCDIASLSSFNSASFSGPPPLVQMVVLEPETTKTYHLQAEDVIAFSSKPYSLPRDFHMAGLPEYNLYFLMSQNELATATPYGADDKVLWRREKGLIEEAWEYSVAHADQLLNKMNRPHVLGRIMIESLMSESKNRYAAKRLPDVCGESKSEWEYFVNEFEQAHLAMLLADVLPTHNPQLEPECYEYILHAALYNDLKMFRKLVQDWNPDLYRVGALTALTLQRIHEASTPNSENCISPDDEVNLMHALANLYVYDRKYDAALRLYISLNDKHIFTVIRKHQLVDIVKEKIPELMSIDNDLAVNLLLTNETAFPPEVVMNQIARQPKLQLAYLKKLFDRNEGVEYSDLAVKLFAEYERPKLLPFLRKSKNYTMKTALEICEQKNFVEERIYLLGKSGNRREALNLMINMKGKHADRSLEMAIDFCKEHEDEELWTLLINEVMKTPRHISHLLNTAGSCIDPLRIIQQIPEDMSIPGLRDSLVKILRDYEVQVLLQKGCQSATLDDVKHMFDCFSRQSHSATYIGLRSACVLCQSSIFTSTSYTSDSILKIFGCSHAAHSKCCQELENKLQERSPGSAYLELLTCPVCTDDSDALSLEV